MQGSQKTALLIEDEDSVRYVLSKQLEHLGYNCVTAASGQEGIDNTSRQKFDLIMLDVMMPGMSGLRVLKELRTGEQHTSVCIVMLTDVIDALEAAEAMKLGADTYVTKPCDLEYLRKRFQHAEKHRAAVNRGDAGESVSEELPQGVVNLGEITKDLIQQQVASFEQATATSSQEN